MLKSNNGKGANPELEQITIQHLLDHRAGWDTSAMGYDPMAEQAEIAKALDKSITELKPQDFVTFMVNKPLQFTPGDKYSYSNLGYVVLGRVIEKISGQNYEAFIRETLMNPLGITSIKVGSSTREKAESNEAIYEPDDELYPHDGYLIEMIDSAGGLISTAVDYCTFMQSYWLNGNKRNQGEESRFISIGGLPGTKTVALQREDGINATILFNKRNVKNQNDHEEVQSLVESLLI